MKPGAKDPFSLENLDFIFRVNLRAVIQLTQLAVPHLEKTRGNIVNISSICSTCAYPALAFYGSLKAALDHMTRHDALMYGPKGIRVNALNPGPVRSAVFERHGVSQDGVCSGLIWALCHCLRGFQFEKYVEGVSPLGRIGLASEMSTILKFLASDEASYITGVTLIADGGASIFKPPLDLK